MTGVMHENWLQAVLLYIEDAVPGLQIYDLQLTSMMVISGTSMQLVHKQLLEIHRLGAGANHYWG